MDTAAGQAHKAADTLRDADQRWLSDMVSTGADELGAFAEMIRSNDFNGLVQRARVVAHRQPGLFAGASVAVGFALARMARVAMEEPSSRRTQDRPARERPHPRSEAFTATGRDTDMSTSPPATTCPGTTYNG